MSGKSSFDVGEIPTNDLANRLADSELDLGFEHVRVSDVENDTVFGPVVAAMI